MQSTSDSGSALPRSPRALPMLKGIRVASPCTANWDEMRGDDRVRFCGSCEKNVFNLSGMTEEEAESLLEATNAQICVRFYQREDGTVLTSDCPVGALAVRKKRRRIAAASVASVFAMLAVACGGEVDGQGSPVVGQVESTETRAVTGKPDSRLMMGEMVADPTPKPATTAKAASGRPPRPMMGAPVPHTVPPK